MNTLAASAEAILLLLGIGVVGYFMLARGIAKPDILPYLSTLALEVSLPLYVFATLVQQFDPSTNGRWWAFPLWWAFFAAVTLLMALVLGRTFPADIRKESVVAMYLYNSLFVPLALIVGLFGTTSVHVAELFLFTLFSVAFYFNFYPVLFRGRTEQAGPRGFARDWKKLFNPLIRMTLFTLAIILLGWSAKIPTVIVSIAQKVGDLAFTLVMLTLGGYIYLDMRSAGRVRLGAVAQFVLFKNVVFPLVFLGIIYALQPGYNVALLLTLSAAAPPLSTIPILTARQNGDVAISNQYLVASFLASIVTVPLMIVLLDRITSLA